MTTGLDDAQRNRLADIVVRSRRLLEEDLSDRAAGRYGIDRNGTLADTDLLHLDPAGLARRADLVDILQHLYSEGLSTAAATARLVHEAAFTHLNRLVAIRIAESLDLLPPALVDGRNSRGFREALELAPLLGKDDTGGYWPFLQLCGDELAADIPGLFDPRNPLLALAPTPVTLDQLVDMLSDTAAASLWSAPDCLGWTYQFLNTDEDRRAARYNPDGSSKPPGDSHDLAVRNQFFTPRYVVDFLLQNSLGRRLVDGDSGSPLLAHLPLLIDPPTENTEPVDLATVDVLDPAVGSAHFLVGAYDLLELAWQQRGVDPYDAAPRIVDALWGIDIDPRCTQVAAAAIVFRARRACRDLPLPRPHIICARALPASATGMDKLLAELPAPVRHLVTELTGALNDAPILGPLLKIEERLATELRGALFGGAVEAGTFADLAREKEGDELQGQVLDALNRIADAATSTPAERLLAAEAGDAVLFVDAVRRRYDVVVMNPPFGEPVPETKPYLKVTYPWIPSKDFNLLAAFVGRGLELCKPEGYVGAITSRAGLFLKTFQDFREQVLLGHHLVALADLGYGVMEQALVEAAAYVVRSTPARPGHHAAFIRLLKDTDRPAGLSEVAAAARAGKEDQRLFIIDLDDLHAVPGSPVAYWMSTSIRRLFNDYPSLEGHGAEVRVGMQTGYDFRFVRAFWEIDPVRIARTRAETLQGKRWVPFAKGGEYSPYWADIHLVVNYANDGEEVRLFPGSVIRNPQYYFRPGLTWSRRTASGFAIRLLPAGCVFSDLGSSAFPDRSQVFQLGAFLSTRLVRGLLDVGLASADETSSGGAARHYNVGLVQNLPWPAEIAKDASAGEFFREAARWRAEQDQTDETTRRFLAPQLLASLRGARPVLHQAIQEAVESTNLQRLLLLKSTLELEDVCFALLGLGAEDIAYFDEEVGPHPASYARGMIDENAFARLYSMTIDDAIDEIVSTQGGSRVVTNLTYFADRRLEVLAHAFKRQPPQLSELRANLGLLPPEQPLEAASDLFSYFVGVAFGRWDVRIGRDPSSTSAAPDLLDSVALCPPGMLIRDDGTPARVAPNGYPLQLPPAGLLLDQPGHRWDVENRITAAAAALLDDPDPLITDVLRVLGRRTIRDVLRRRFFKDHLSRYSKSRRRAPIYWPLSVPSGAWGVWVYAPVLTRETLYAIAGAAADRLSTAEAEILRLERERDSGGAGRSPAQVATALDAEQRLAEELRVFRAEADRIAGLGWEPDLDDGIVLCAAPLAGLFPAWKDAAVARAELRAGKYPWATVSRWKDQL